MKFEVSVVIPVFNAERYIEKAIFSALEQPEVKEVIIVNDGSTDRTCLILERICKENSKVLIYEHSAGKNLGRSASRNLGIKKAMFGFVAFLDADDYYLPGRFLKDKSIFSDNPDIDGVYNAIGVHFYRPASRNEIKKYKITTLNKFILPENLFYEMWPKGYCGRFSGDGLTVKKSIFLKVGFFNEMLQVAEDTEMWIKMSLKANLYPGILDYPVSIRGIHLENSVKEIGKPLYIRNYFFMYRSLLKWGSRNKIPFDALDYFWERFYQHNRLINNQKDKFFKSLIFWLKCGLEFPRLFYVKRYYRTFPLFKYR